MPIGWENGWYMMGFVVSLCYVAVLSDLILVCAKFCETQQTFPAPVIFIIICHALFGLCLSFPDHTNSAG